MNWFAKFGYVVVIVVSTMVGLWNYLVALSLLFAGSGVLDLLVSLESLFTVFVALFMVFMSLEKLKLAGGKK